jgi:5,6,7,8-tetrahydromethanopterin hydro-lyase
MVPKVAMTNAADVVKMYGPAQAGIAKAIADSVEMGILAKTIAENWVCVCTVVIDPNAKDDLKIVNNNYQAMCIAITEAMNKQSPNDTRKRPDRLPIFQVGEALVGEGNEVAHIDLVIGSKTGPVGAAFTKALAYRNMRHPNIQAHLVSGLPCKPEAALITKVTIKNPKQSAQINGPARHAVAQAVADCVSSSVILRSQADDLVVLAAVFVHWEATSDEKIYQYNYEATKLSLKRAMVGEPSIDEITAKKRTLKHPFSPI